MTELETHLRTTVDRQTKFRTLGAKRINNALKAVSLIGNLSNRSVYEYSDSDIKKMISALRTAVDKVEARFVSTPKSNGGFSF
jgi:hypothetical protein